MAEEELLDPAEPDVLAGEYALGVLEGEELATAQRLFLSDREFAERVDWWRLRLSCMAEAAGEFEPSATVWPAIKRRIEAQAEDLGNAPQDMRKPIGRGSSGWAFGLGMGGAAAAAAVLTLILVPTTTTPPPTPVETAAPVPSERLIAQLQSEDGELSLSGIVDPQAGQIAVNLSGFAPSEGQATELWVVPEGGAPQSLGLIPASGTFERELTDQERASLVEGAALAVTYEDTATAPHGAPSSDILVFGGLTRI